MNNQELLKACLEKLELYHAAVKGEYPGGVPNMVLLPALREAIANPASRPEERTQEAMTLLREAHMFANAQAFVADDYDAHCDRLAKFLGYTVDTHGPIKEKE